MWVRPAVLLSLLLVILLLLHVLIDEGIAGVLIVLLLLLRWHLSLVHALRLTALVSLLLVVIVLSLPVLRLCSRARIVKHSQLTLCLLRINLSWRTLVNCFLFGFLFILCWLSLVLGKGELETRLLLWCVNILLVLLSLCSANINLLERTIRLLLLLLFLHLLSKGRIWWLLILGALSTLLLIDALKLI
jgi:hypothetical protein